MAGTGKKTKDEFNGQVAPVLMADLDVFLQKLGNGMCAIAVGAEYKKPLDVPAIKQILERNGGHINAVRESHLYAWANAAAIREIRDLPNVELVTPYRNWTDPNSIPLQTMQRPDVTMRPNHP